MMKRRKTTSKRGGRLLSTFSFGVYGGVVNPWRHYISWNLEKHADIDLCMSSWERGWCTIVLLPEQTSRTGVIGIKLLR
jgi:hypothetical protein